MRRQTVTVIRPGATSSRMLLTLLSAVMASLLSAHQAVAQHDELHFEISDEYPDNSFVGDVADEARLPQSFPENWESFQYGFLPQSNQDATPFNLDTETGLLYTAQRMDRDERCPGQMECFLYIDVAVVEPRSHFMVFTAKVTVTDINDNDPFFTPDLVDVKLSESSPEGTSVPLPKASDVDSPDFGVSDYRLLTSTSQFELRVVRESSGMPSGLSLVLLTSLDREETSFYRVEVAALDRGSPARTGTLTVDVFVEDANDHRPKFDNSSLTVYAPEDFPLNTTLLQVHASDSDSGIHGQVHYEVMDKNGMGQDLFMVMERTGEIKLLKHVDYEKQKVHELRVVARDGGSTSLSAVSTVTVHVLDVNDNWPEMTVNTFTSDQQAHVKENKPAGEFVAHISVFDADLGENGKAGCSVDHHSFLLLPLRVGQYKLVTSRPLDREAHVRHVVPLACADLGEPPRSSSVLLTVAVIDENDHTPAFTNQGIYTADIYENNKPAAFILQLNATDGDIGENARLSYFLSEDTDPFIKGLVRLDENTGNLTARQGLDHEMVELLEFRVKVVDNGDPSRSASSRVKILIRDVNDEPPRFRQDSFSVSVEENNQPRLVIAQLTATDTDSAPYNSFRYSLHNSYSGTFSVDHLTGEIRTLVSLDREHQDRYELEVVAADDQVASLRSTATATIYVMDQNDNRPIIKYPALINNTIRVSSHIPVGRPVLQILASDRDSGVNARLHYRFTEGRRDLFSVNLTSGQVVSLTSLEHVRYQEFGLRLVVEDGGHPVLVSDSLDLFVVVDHNVPYVGTEEGGTEAGEAGSPSTNLIIIIIVASVSGVLTLLLIVAIALVKTYDNRKYRNKQEEDRKQLEAGCDVTKQRRPMPSHTVVITKHEDGDTTMPPKQSPVYSSDNQLTLTSPSTAGSSALRPSSISTGLEAHLLGLLRSDQPDSESWSSGDTADSGRGPSEHGEHHNHHLAASPAQRADGVVRQVASPARNGGTSVRESWRRARERQSQQLNRQEQAPNIPDLSSYPHVYKQRLNNSWDGQPSNASSHSNAQHSGGCPRGNEQCGDDVVISPRAQSKTRDRNAQKGGGHDTGFSLPNCHGGVVKDRVNSADVVHLKMDQPPFKSVVV